MAFIELNHISKIYGEKENQIIALDDINLKIEKNEFIVILGPSGAGKSTLLNILGGMDLPSKGDYIVNDILVNNIKDKDLAIFRRNEIGFVFQFYNLMNNLNAYENVLLATKGIKNHLDPLVVLESVGLKNRVKNFPSHLSGGEQQRVSIARAIVKNPSILLCDEPTGALDSKTGMKIIALLKNIASQGNSAVIMVTHNSKIAEVADRVIEINDGKIVKDYNNTIIKKVEDIKW